MAEIQGSTASLNARIEEEKEFRHRSLNEQRGYEGTLKQLSGEGLGSRMGIELYDKSSMLRGKIADEKEKRRKSHTIQTLLSQKKDEVIASATGKPTANRTRAPTRLPFKQRPMLTEASSSGRVLAAGSSERTSSGQSEDMGVGTPQSELDKPTNSYFVGIEGSFETDNPLLGHGSTDEWEQGMPSIPQALWHSFPDCYPSVAERFEEDDDPDACLGGSSSANHEYEETETSTSAPTFPSQENEVLYTDYTLNSEFPTPLYTDNYLTDFICCCSIDHCRILELGIRRRHVISRHDERLVIAHDYWCYVRGSKHIYP